jgi:hypothetical protein
MALLTFSTTIGFTDCLPDCSKVLIAKEPRQAVSVKITDVKKEVKQDNKVVVVASLEEENGRVSNVYYEIKRDGTLTTWW